MKREELFLHLERRRTEMPVEIYRQQGKIRVVRMNNHYAVEKLHIFYERNGKRIEEWHSVMTAPQLYLCVEYFEKLRKDVSKW